MDPALHPDFPCDSVQWVTAIARKLVRRFPRQRSEIEELISTGLLALAEAMQNIDVERNGTGKSYAYIRIRGAMLDYIRRDARRYALIGEIASLSVLAEAGVEPEARGHDCPERRYVKKQLGRMLATLIQEIPDRDRSVLLDHAVYGRKHAEIARRHAMKTRSFTTKSLERSRKALVPQCLDAGLESYISAG